MHRIVQIAVALGLTLLILEPADSATPMTGESTAPSRLIVKFTNAPQKSVSAPNENQLVSAMAFQSGVGMQITRALSGGAKLVNVDGQMTEAELTAMAEKLSRQPGIEYAEPDVRVYPALTPNDPRFVNQYYLKDARVEPGAINAPQAWNLTTGSAATVVAVIDSGIRPEHIDIGGRLVPGYDFISADPDGGFLTANDGDGRDNNPSDPGDTACGPVNERSLWHGTRVASLIGAVTNDGQGMAGVDWGARILPVRALERCGAYSSDLVDAIRWAAGLPVPGVPANPNPARIINLSIRAPGITCTQVLQEAVDDVIATGALAVVAAGNGATNALRTMPANCKGVLPVAATTRGGGPASFSNTGAKVALSAPGVGILTAANRGFQAPLPNGDTYTALDGTSFSSPLVAGVAALMLSLNSNLTPGQLIGTLRATAHAFPVPQSGTRCSTSLCGAGLLDAAAAVRAVATGNIVAGADGGNGLRAAFAGAAPLQLGVPRTSSLSKPFKFDVYHLTLPSAGRLRLATSGSTDTYGYLFSAGGQLLAQNDDINIALTGNFRIDALLSQGTYYVAVEGYDSGVRGHYRLSANLSP